MLFSAAPYLAHWTPAFPAFYAALSVPVALWLTDITPRVSDRLRWTPRALVAAGLTVLGFANINFYFRDYYASANRLELPIYREAQQKLELRAAQAHRQASLGPAFTVQILGSQEYQNNPELPFLMRDQDYAPLANPDRDLPVERVPNKGLAFVLMPGSERYLGMLRKFYPEGKEGEVRGRDGTHLFSTFVLPPE